MQREKRRAVAKLILKGRGNGLDYSSFLDVTELFLKDLGWKNRWFVLRVYTSKLMCVDDAGSVSSQADLEKNTPRMFHGCTFFCKFTTNT